MPHKQRQFWSQLATKYDQVVDLQLGARTRSLVRERLAREKGLGKVVELGCGTGFFTRALAERAAYVVATDLAPAMIEMAQQQTHLPNLFFQVEDCQKTSFPDAAFDTAFMALVIQLTQPEHTLAEMRRLLKPGGRLIVVNLDLGALGKLSRLCCQMRLFYYGLTRYRVKPPRGFMKHLMTLQQLDKKLTQAGFKVVSAETLQDPSRRSNVPVDYVTALRG